MEDVKMSRKNTSTDKIKSKAIEIISDEMEGIRYAELHRRISETYRDIPVNTIHGILQKFRADLPSEIYQPARGHYQHISFTNKTFDSDAQKQEAEYSEDKITEDNFYRPFADWLVNDLEECTKAIPVGGNIFRDKWGTPDVIGVRESKRSDIIQAPTEIVAAEIKIDLNGLITAFGQCCSYKLFSHRAYIVVPQNASEEDISRIDSLARIFGIGFILFNALKTK